MLLVSFISLVIIFTISAYQLSNLGDEAEKLVMSDIPMSELVVALDRDVFKQSIRFRQLWQAQLSEDGGEQSKKQQIRYRDQFEQLLKNQSVLKSKMMQYIHARIPANTRIQGVQKDKLLQSTEAYLNSISLFLQQYLSLSDKLFQEKHLSSPSQILAAESELRDLDDKLHKVNDGLLLVVSKAVAQANAKINNISYGAIQLISFVLYWLLFVGLLCGIWVIRKLPSSSSTC